MNEATTTLTRAGDNMQTTAQTLDYVSPRMFEQRWTADQQQDSKSAYLAAEDSGKRGQDHSVSSLVYRGDKVCTFNCFQHLPTISRAKPSIPLTVLALCATMPQRSLRWLIQAAL